MSLKVAITIYKRTGEWILTMKQAPRIGDYISIDKTLFLVKKVWWNLNDDPKMKYDVRLFLSEED